MGIFKRKSKLEPIQYHNVKVGDVVLVNAVAFLVTTDGLHQLPVKKIGAE